MTLSPTSSHSGGTLAKLYDFTITGADQASIDSNVDGTTVANFSGYDVLQIWGIARTDDAAALVEVDMTLNNDTGANYDLQSLNATNATVTAAPTLGDTKWALLGHGSGGTANYAGLIKVLIPGYAGTTFYKTADINLVVNDGTAANNRVNVRPGTYRSTSAITRVKIAATVGQKLKVGSRLIVYGQ